MKLKCYKCLEEKDISFFKKDKKQFCGHSNLCKFCRNKLERKRYKSNPNIQKNERLKRLYNISYEKYTEECIKQNDKCKICDGLENRVIFGKQVLSVDHNHKTGKFRGLLCHKCNTAIGHFKENIELLHNAIKYLEKSWDA